MWLALAIGVLIAIVAPAAARRATDWLWYREIGFERIFFTKIVAQWILGLATGIGTFVLLYLNGRIALR